MTAKQYFVLQTLLLFGGGGIVLGLLCWIVLTILFLFGWVKTPKWL